MKGNKIKLMIIIATTVIIILKLTTRVIGYIRSNGICFCCINRSGRKVKARVHKRSFPKIKVTLIWAIFKVTFSIERVFVIMAGRHLHQ